MLLIATCTSVYKQAQKQPFLNCLCLWGGAFTYILYFGVQTGTKTNLFLVIYIYVCGAFLSHLVFRCTNRHQNKPISSCLCLWVGAFSRILYFDVQPGTKTNLFLVVYVYGMVLFSHLVLRCTNRHRNKPILVVYVYGVVLLLASCTSTYKQAPTQAYLTGVKLFMFMGWCF